MTRSNRKATSKRKASPAAKPSRTSTKTKAAAAPKKKAVAKAAPRKAAAKAPAKRAAKGKTPAAPEKLPRRAIFIDVENTSNEEGLSKVIDGLGIDRAVQPTELYAFGNWRAVGQMMSRHLARLGATLVHTSPVTGVKDWSDLWIAVAAGRWIALAQPGDILEIVSNDKAFEAVGDAAANSGVVFRRVLHRTSSSSTAHAAHAAAAAADSDDGPPRRRRRRGGRGRRGGSARSTSAATAEKAPLPSRPPRSEAPLRQAPAPKAEPAPRREAPVESQSPPADGHGASHDQVLATIRRLTGGDPNRWVNLDVIANALKAEGFTRPPGSTRLVVRLRRMKDVEVQPSGMVRVVG